MPTPAPKQHRKNCHRCGKEVGLQGGANVLARHKPTPGRGYWEDHRGICLGAGENPCLIGVGHGHEHPCRAIIETPAADQVIASTGSSAGGDR